MPDLQIAATTNANGVAFNVLRCGAAAFQVSGTFSATVNFEATIDQSNWFAISATNVTTNVSATTTTTTGAYVVNCAAFVLVRARISGYVSGTVSVFAEAAAGGGVGTVGGSSSGTQYTDGGAAVPNGTGTALIWFDGSSVPQDVRPTTPMPQTRYTSAGVEIGLPANPDTIQGPIAPGSSAAGTRPVLAGGSDGTNARTFSTLTDGTLNTFNTAALNAVDDRISSVIDTASIGNAGTLLTPKFVAIAAATNGANTLLAAVTNKKIRVLALTVIAGAAGNIYFTTAAAGAVIFGGSTNKINLAANGGFVLPFSPVGWFETVAGDLLNMNASSTGPFSGGLVYVEV